MTEINKFLIEELAETDKALAGVRKAMESNTFAKGTPEYQHGVRCKMETLMEYSKFLSGRLH